MKLSKEVVDELNRVLSRELTAINQYFLHARMLGNWGLARLAGRAYEQSIARMKRADRIVQRVLLLEGLPNLQSLGKLYVGESPEETLECDLRREREDAEVLRASIGRCEANRDYVSRDLLEELLEASEEQIDWLETQRTLIEDLGVALYLQGQVHD
ncbi:MAG: bacterioferritin [Lysobacteraceae bacterium]|nr:MAG: bacterioferritin [Xanthomonadaceae bacterium]